MLVATLLCLPGLVPEMLLNLISFNLKLESCLGLLPFFESITKMPSYGQNGSI